MEDKLSIVKILSMIQTELKAPKNQFNKFGRYKYRSCEDILEGVKPLLAQHNCIVLLTDDIHEVNGRFYVKATASFQTPDGQTISTTAYAREAHDKKGMDDAQLTGSCSSYARKYALNGLFCIDDTKDADTRNNDLDKVMKKSDIIKMLNSIGTVDALESFWKKHNKFIEKHFIAGEYDQIISSFSDRKQLILNKGLKN
ncbi:MAG: hypothetical protein OMM_00546 [Candidatus Magnetoglobus multicellularis str. Araruama]|uniref:ERF family protein n=1 Tax=Candidatus Magnetoglobus multicellularis str. Araruama TaxID=890399 RepID=A0A1V1PGU0_9BACT|nr:MAG: hypothetical protein OMM_00546 [Candidatus Magnetoglobus multicellularis str. Araruama]